MADQEGTQESGCSRVESEEIAQGVPVQGENRRLGRDQGRARRARCRQREGRGPGLDSGFVPTALRLSAIAIASVTLFGTTPGRAEQPPASSPANGTATRVSEETLRSLVALATDRKRHPIKVEDVTAFLAQFGPVQRDQWDREELKFNASKQPQVKVEVNYSKDAEGHWVDPECIFYVVDPPRTSAIFKTLARS